MPIMKSVRTLLFNGAPPFYDAADMAMVVIWPLSALDITIYYEHGGDKVHLAPSPSQLIIS
jgi:hypothetical protein